MSSPCSHDLRRAELLVREAPQLQRHKSGDLHETSRAQPRSQSVSKVRSGRKRLGCKGVARSIGKSVEDTGQKNLVRAGALRRRKWFGKGGEGLNEYGESRLAREDRREANTGLQVGLTLRRAHVKRETPYDGRRPQRVVPPSDPTPHEPCEAERNACVPRRLVPHRGQAEMKQIA